MYVPTSSLPDMYVIGLAIRCLGLLGVATEVDALPRFGEYKEKIHLFLDNEIKEISIAELARQALSAK